MSDTITIAEQLVQAYRQAGVRLAVAESCTGGLLGGAITAIAGASDIYEGGMLTYSNTAKQTLLSVPQELLRDFGAVSEQVAMAMAEGVLRNLPSADVALSVTGVAGPGQSENKPAGLVYIGGATRNSAPQAQCHQFSGDRTAVRTASVEAALKFALELL